MVKPDDSEGEYNSEFTGKKFVVDLGCAAVIIAAWGAGYWYFEPFKNSDGMGG